MISLVEALIAQAEPLAEARRVERVVVGPYWAAVCLASRDRPADVRCGLSSLPHEERHDHTCPPGAPAGSTAGLPLKDAVALVRLLRSDDPVEAAVGMAAINACLEVDERQLTEINAAEVLAERGAGKRVAIVGHFPFVERIRRLAAQAWVLELRPREGDLPASAAEEVLPQADVVGLTGLTVVNHTFDALQPLLRPDAYVVMLGGSTPLTPLLFAYRVDLAAGCLVDDAEAALSAVEAGTSFRQMPGRRLVALAQEGSDATV